MIILTDIHDVIVSFINNFKDLMNWRHTCKHTFHTYTANFYCTRMYSFIKTPFVEITHNTNLSLLSQRHYIKRILIRTSKIKNEHIMNLINLEQLVSYYCSHRLTDIAFGNLSKLRTLHCNYEITIDDDIIRKLPNLTDLDCSYCKNVSNVSLSTLTNLVKLSCIGASILDTTFIKSLTKLEYLSIFDAVQNNKESMSKLINLKTLHLSDNSKIKPEIIKLLPKLELVDCGIYEFTDDHLINLTNIRKLICGINCFFTDLSFRQLTKLKILDIDWAHILLDDDTFSTLTELTELHLGNRLILTDQVFINMSKMRKLYCDRNIYITDNCLKYMPNLIELDCGSNNNFTDNAIIELHDLEILRCGECINITDNCLKHMSNLIELDCGNNNNFTDSAIMKLHNLETLKCGNCTNITDTTLLHLQNLTVLHCGSNRNFGNGLLQISKKLKKIDYTSNTVEGLLFPRFISVYKAARNNIFKR